MNRNIFASLLAMLVLCTATFAQKKAKKDSTDNDEEKVIVVEIDNSNVLIGVQKLSERVALPEGNGEFYAVVMVVYDTTYSRKTGKIKKVVAYDYIVHMHKGSYDKFKNLRGICYMHAKWSKKNTSSFVKRSGEKKCRLPRTEQIESSKVFCRASLRETQPYCVTIRSQRL